MAGILKKSLSRVHMAHHKNTVDMATEVMPVPDLVTITMSQHLGPPCDVLVKAGDEVKVGQMIGDSGAFLSAPIHSSVSGRVLRIDEITMPSGMRCPAVVIETDKQQEPAPDLQKPVVQSHGDFVAAVRASGIVGLGGAGFPTHIKLNPKNRSEINTLLINAAECEPYITSDFRTMIEDTADVMEGIRAVMQWMEIPACVIVIEDNKPEAIHILQEACGKTTGVSVQIREASYPQGAEKVLIHEALGRVIPEGKLPADVGCVVLNVTTVARIAQYLRTGMPLVTKRLTVDGSAVAQPKNLLVPIGVSIQEVIDCCGGYRQDLRKIMMGGPMMGIALYDAHYPIVKNNNAIIAMGEDQAKAFEDTPCIRCGRCVRGCPMRLMPLRMEAANLRDDLESLRDLRVTLCIECGNCSYVCPARRHLVQSHRISKARLRQQDAK